MNKLNDIISKIFSIGIIICLFAGGLSIGGYIIAIIMGSEKATAVCIFIYNTYLPYVIRFTTVFTGFGLLSIYLSKLKTLISNIKTKKSKIGKIDKYTLKFEEKGNYIDKTNSVNNKKIV